ncbi:MAG: prepilin-type N-terminal cleavage/methylation domain-containing protein [Armatimonadota bacterium]
MKRHIKGFTLVELLIVTVIVAAVIVIALYTQAGRKSVSQAYYAAGVVRSDLLHVKNKVLTYEPGYSAGILNGTQQDSWGYKDYKYQDDLYNSTPSEKVVSLAQYGGNIRISIPGGECRFKKDGTLDSAEDKIIIIKMKNKDFYGIKVYKNGSISEILKLN